MESDPSSVVGCFHLFHTRPGGWIRIWHSRSLIANEHDHPPSTILLFCFHVMKHRSMSEKCQENSTIQSSELYLSKLNHLSSMIWARSSKLDHLRLDHLSLIISELYRLNSIILSRFSIIWAQTPSRYWSVSNVGLQWTCFCSHIFS